MLKYVFAFLTCFSIFFTVAQSQEKSVARLWNEVLLEAIRNDFARPTVHARNLFHTSVVMYDAWAAYDSVAQTYFLGKETHDFPVPFNGVDAPLNPLTLKRNREEAISYAAYRLLTHRFENSPGASHSLFLMDSLFAALGYDKEKTSWNYASGDPAALGNYIAAYMINFGQQDGSNELNDYENRFYEPVNPALDLSVSGNPDLIDPNRWQPLKFDTFVDQSGNLILGGQPDFLSPEWGMIAPFSLKTTDLEKHIRDSNEYWLYHDPGPPPFIDTLNGQGGTAFYQWGFELVSVWTGHLDPADTTMWDISPNSIGNIPFENLPDNFSEYPDFYKLEEGGDISQGYELNPITGEPYDQQWKKRGDYTRVLAEFWADGPDSETPPGHWYTILNEVMDYPQFEHKFKGEGEVLNVLEYDVKAYFTLGGAMHDVAIVSWGLKGWYDYIRPISAIRFMAKMGQSSDSTLPNYHPAGLKLIPGFVELIDSVDALAGTSFQNVGKVKVKSWRGHEFILNAETDIAGVDWILPRKWWPYQRPSFVTPPFAGYVSGHSTYSRAAAEVMTMLTGSEYFPGGIGRFIAPKNDFLAFEKGPSDTVVLEWAKYYDASDQCSLSRIWGGIHPPADDIPGRKLGRVIGIEAFEKAEQLFLRDTADTTTGVDALADLNAFKVSCYPNPNATGMVNVRVNGKVSSPMTIRIFNAMGSELRNEQWVVQANKGSLHAIDLSMFSKGLYHLRFETANQNTSAKVVYR
ncbi:MAG: DUF6851 domain-containing protein [Salibacteraceae bacterium]